MTDREILIEALYALEDLAGVCGFNERQKAAYQSLQARLAQPNDFSPDWDAMAVMVEEQQRMSKRIEELEAALAQPEPWVKTYSGGKPNYTEPCERCGEVNPAEIHTCTPKQREMNKDEYIKFLESACRDIYEVWAGSEGIPMPETAPEGYLLFLVEQMRDIAKRALDNPPQREWVGLTDDEIDDIWAKFNDGYSIIEETLWGYERAIEAKLREKNA